jgi:ribosome modulation factor
MQGTKAITIKAMLRVCFLIFVLTVFSLVWAEAGELEDIAYRLGVEAAKTAQSDPAKAEDIIAARYREVLALTQDQNARERVKAAFQRGYQETLAGIERPPVPSVQQKERIYNITPARDVAWGRPVGQSDVFTPDTNPIYVWFRHEGFPAGTAITAVWYFLGTPTPYKIGEGTVTVTQPSDWGQFNYELEAGKRWPLGDYRVELLVAGTPVGEARFRIVKEVPSTVATPVPSPTQTISWNTNAADKRGKNGQQFTYLCPANGTPHTVWGTDVYTDDSSICTAAVHAGLITFQTGGAVTIEIKAGQSNYIGSNRNSVSTKSYASWHGSFIFVGSTSLPSMPSISGLSRPGQPYTHPKLSFSLTAPPGWTIDDQVKDVVIQMRRSQGVGLINVYSVETEGEVDPAVAATTAEAEMVGPGKGFDRKLDSRLLTVDGSPAYEGTYDSSTVRGKMVVVSKPRRVFMLVGIFETQEFNTRAADFDHVVESFSAEVPPAKPPVTNPLGETLKWFEGIGNILKETGR